LLLTVVLKKFSGVERLKMLLIYTNGQKQPTPFSLTAVLLSLSTQIFLSPSPSPSFLPYSSHDLNVFISYKNLTIRVFDYH
jgi:hypothetical protein